MVDCPVVEISTVIPPGQMSGVDSNVIRRHVSNVFDGKSEQVSRGRI
jgi:hypothetical protein